MTIDEIRALIAQKIAGQGTMVDAAGGLPAILNALCDAIAAIPAPPAPYVLPTASAETLGGVKIGDGLQISENGVLSKGRKILEVSQASSFTGKTKEETIARLGITGAELDKLMAGYYDVVHDKNEGFCMCLITYIDGASYVLYGGILASNAHSGESFELYFSEDNTYSLKQVIV